MISRKSVTRAGLTAAVAALLSSSPAAADSRSNSGSKGRPWSIEDALPDHSSAMRANKPEVTADEGPGLGRLPLQSGPGSFGFEAETKMKPDKLPDGRPIPGLTPTTEAPSYFGLSVSVPTSGK
jgi:hypothetical protein